MKARIWDYSYYANCRIVSVIWCSNFDFYYFVFVCVLQGFIISKICFWEKSQDFDEWTIYAQRRDIFSERGCPYFCRNSQLIEVVRGQLESRISRLRNLQKQYKQGCAFRILMSSISRWISLLLMFRRYSFPRSVLH